MYNLGTDTNSIFLSLSLFPPLFCLFQCILIIYTDTCLRPFESDMPNLGRESKVPLRGLHTPLLPSLTSHPSSLTFPPDTCNTEATYDLWTPRVLIGCIRCCKGDSSLSLPVYPSAPSSLVVVVLCSCSPGLSCGVLVLVLISQRGQVQTHLPVSSCRGQHKSWLDVKKDGKKSHGDKRMIWIWEWWILV